MASVDYGRDTSCTTGLRTGRIVAGVVLVGQAAFRRLTTRRGLLSGGREEAEYGLDLGDLVGSIASSADRVSIPGKIHLELTKDERIIDTTTTLVSSTVGPATTYTITVVGRLSAGPSFRLVVAVVDVTVELLGITAEN